MQSTIPIAIAGNANKRNVGPNAVADESVAFQRQANNREMISSSLSSSKSSGFNGRRRSSSVRDALSAFFGTGNSRPPMWMTILIWQTTIIPPLHHQPFCVGEIVFVPILLPMTIILQVLTNRIGIGTPCRIAQ